MNLAQLKEIVSLLSEQIEKKEILEQQVQVMFQDESDLYALSPETFRIVETQEGFTMVAIDISSFLECDEEELL